MSVLCIHRFLWSYHSFIWANILSTYRLILKFTTTTSKTTSKHPVSKKKKSVNFEVSLLEEIFGPSRLLRNTVWGWSLKWDIKIERQKRTHNLRQWPSHSNPKNPPKWFCNMYSVDHQWCLESIHTLLLSRSMPLDLSWSIPFYVGYGSTQDTLYLPYLPESF